jgi:hypothetical protein
MNKVFLVGRKNSSRPCDINLPETELSVSRHHLELTVANNGVFYILNLEVRNSTMVKKPDGAWMTVTQAKVEVDTPIRLGEYETTPRKLLSMIGQDPSL